MCEWAKHCFLVVIIWALVVPVNYHEFTIAWQQFVVYRLKLKLFDQNCMISDMYTFVDAT